MTASTNKKLRKKKRRKREIIVFFCVLLAVLTVGGIVLALMAVSKETEKDTGIPMQEVEQETIFAEIMGTAEGLLSNMQSELPIQQEREETAGRYDTLLSDPEMMREQNTYAKEAASPEEIIMTFAGDILFDPQYAVMANLVQRGGKIEEAFSEDLLAVMRGADIFMVNNEFPYTNRGTSLPEKQFTFRAEPERAAYLTEMGVDIVSLANNHAYDFGEVSLLDSLDTLNAMKMPYVGAGRNLEEASRPVSFIINDRKIAIIAATQIERNDNPDTKGAGENSPGTFRCWNADNLLKAVAAAKEENDIVIVYIHWGTENQAETDWAQDDQAIKIAEAGADVIIGAHSHCLQPVGYVKGVPVVYSLGNFWFNSKSLDTALAQVVVSTEGEVAVRVLPAKQSDCRTQLLNGTEKQRVIEYINSISTGGYLDEEGWLLPFS